MKTIVAVLLTAPVTLLAVVAQIGANVLLSERDECKEAEKRVQLWKKRRQNG